MLSGTGWWLWPTKPGDRRGVPHRGPGLVGEVHPDQHVAGENGALDHLALPVLDLGDLLGGDHDLVDVVLHVEGDDAVLEVGLHPVLHAGVGVHHEPVARLGPQLATERLQRVLGLVDRRLGGLLRGDLDARPRPPPRRPRPPPRARRAPRRPPRRRPAPRQPRPPRPAPRRRDLHRVVVLRDLRGRGALGGLLGRLLHGLVDRRDVDLGVVVLASSASGCACSTSVESYCSDTCCSITLL